MVVSFLNSKGIRVISYREGEIGGIDANHGSKLMTYIRYWQAEGESLKTSARCSDAIEQQVRQGRWRGGRPPLGYRTVSRGTLNYKGKPIFDIETDPEQAEVVRQIFRMYTKEHYGLKLIARTLNDKGIRTKDGKLFGPSKLSQLLRCPTYTGYVHLHRLTKEKELIISPFMERLKIIDSEVFDEAQRLLTNNKLKPLRSRPTRHGKLLLTGIAYCGECGGKLTSHYYFSPGDRKKPIEERRTCTSYHCRSFVDRPLSERKCNPSTWSTQKLDEIVVRDAKQFIAEIDREKLLSSYDAELQASLLGLGETHKRHATEVKRLETEVTKLKEEVLKTLLGQSSFKQETLAEMLSAKETELLSARERLTAAQQALTEVEAARQRQLSITSELNDWEARFDSLDTASKKSMLLNIIDKITVYGTEVVVDYNLSIESATDITLTPADELHAAITATKLTKPPENPCNHPVTGAFSHNSLVKGCGQVT